MMWGVDRIVHPMGFDQFFSGSCHSPRWWSLVVASINSIEVRRSQLRQVGM